MKKGSLVWKLLWGLPILATVASFIAYKFESPWIAIIAWLLALIFDAPVLGALALAKLNTEYGWNTPLTQAPEENTVLLFERSNVFDSMFLNSETHRFKGGSDALTAWETEPGDRRKMDPLDEFLFREFKILRIPGWPAVKIATKELVCNIHEKRPVVSGARISEGAYKIEEKKILFREFPRFLYHPFETAALEAMGTNHQKDIDPIMFVKMQLMNTLEVTNFYKLLYTTADDGDYVTLANFEIDTTAREIVADYDYEGLVKAKTAPNDPTSFHSKFKARANQDGALKEIGLELTGVRIMNHWLADPEQERLRLEPANALLRKRAMISDSEGQMQADKIIAKGRAAEIKEAMKAAGGNAQIVTAQFQMKSAEAYAGFGGQVLTVNNGTGTASNAPLPTIPLDVLKGRPTVTEEKRKERKPKPRKKK